MPGIANIKNKADSMVYDPEKYREKREKVLGIKKRGIGFGTLAALVAAVIILGIGAVTVPQAVSYMTLRHLDDSIFKLESDMSWPDNILQSLDSMDGVAKVVKDKNGARLVVTYDRRKVAAADIQTRFASHNLDVTLLNQLNHLQHQATLKDEEEDLETP
jgi:hypothetical protein